jgi:glycosyltransferase involved in cell wall biosynthesis
MNILYINHYAGSVQHGMEYRPYFLAQEWIKQGHNVIILASDFSHVRTQNIMIPSHRNYLIENINSIKYIWFKTRSYKGNGIGRVLNIFIFLKRVKQFIPQLLKEFTPDLIIASSTYPFDTKIAYLIAQKTKAKFVYEVHDLWPLTPIELGKMSKHHPYMWYMQQAENFAYKKADKVVSLLPLAQNYMIEHGMNPNKFIYIPNGINLSEINNNEQLDPEFKDRILAIKNQFKMLVGYAGGMGDANALNFLIEAANQLPHIAFVLIGDGPNKENLVMQVAQNNLNNVFLFAPIVKKQVKSFLELMDVLYIGWNKLSIYRFGISPNKLFDYMLAAKPIIHSISAGNDLVQEAHCGISVPAQDVNSIAHAIKQIENHTPQELKRLGTNGLNYVLKYHDYSLLAHKFLTECGF